MRKKIKIKRDKSTKESKHKVPFCPYCKTIIKKVYVRETTSYTTYSERTNEFTKDGYDREEDWNDNDGEDGNSDAEALCGNCEEDISDIIYEVTGEYVYIDDIDLNDEIIRDFLIKGNMDADKAMVEML